MQDSGEFQEKVITLNDVVHCISGSRQLTTEPITMIYSDGIINPKFSTCGLTVLLPHKEAVDEMVEMWQLALASDAWNDE